jgi:hypothetical protein
MSMKLVRQAAITRLASLFPTHKEMINVFEIEDNPDSVLAKSYGAVWGECLQADSPTRRVGFNSDLIVYLSYRTNIREHDQMASQIDLFYDDVDTIVKSFFDQSMLGLSSTIRGIKRLTVASPRLISGNQFILFELGFTIDYTIPINII